MAVGKWSPFAIVAAGGTTVADFTVGHFRKGPGVDKYGVKWESNPDGTVFAAGPEAFKLLAYMKGVWFWDWPSEVIIREIRRWSPQTKIGVVYAFECIPNLVQKHPGAELLRQVSLSHLLVGTDGKPVDPYYGTDRSASYVEIEKPGYIDAYLNTIQMVHEAYYLYDRPDWGCPDSLLVRPYHGSAPNAPVRDEGAYCQAWEDFTRIHTERISPLFGNTNGTLSFPAVRWRYEEWLPWRDARQYYKGHVPILSPFVFNNNLPERLPNLPDAPYETGYVAARSGSWVWFPTAPV